MQRKYKILSVIVVVLLVIVVGVPYFFGFASKRYVLGFVRRQNKTLSHSMGLHLSLKNYHRGWFQSTVTLLVQKVDDQKVETLQTLPLIIQHGPIYKAHRQYTAGLGVIRTGKLDGMSRIPYSLAFDESMAFNGKQTLYLEVIAKHHADFLPGLGFKSLMVVGTGNIHADQFKSSTHINGLHIKTQDHEAAAKVDNIELKLDANYLKPKHWQLLLNLNAVNTNFTLGAGANKQVSGELKQLHLQHVHIDSEKVMQLITTAMHLKAQGAAERHQAFGQWVHWLQNAFSEFVSSDTYLGVSGLSLNTPYGPIAADYNVSFPGLLKKHDYFDIAVHDVGRMKIDVPHFHVMNPQHNLQLALTNLSLTGQSNMIYSRTGRMSFDVLSLNNIKPTQDKTDFYASGGSYLGKLFGDANKISQTLLWQLDKICWQGSCLQKIDTDLQLLNLNTSALRLIADVMNRAVIGQHAQQSQLAAAQWLDLMQAYLKLVRPDTKFMFSHKMVSPKGDVTLHATLSWPDFPKTVTLGSLMSQVVYQLHFLFPAAYLNDYLTQHPAVMPATQKPAQPDQVAAWLRFALDKGYFKQEGDMYAFDLSGKSSTFTINGHPWVMPSKATLGLDQVPAKVTHEAPANETGAMSKMMPSVKIDSAPAVDKKSHSTKKTIPAEKKVSVKKPQVKHPHVKQPQVIKHLKPIVHQHN